MAKFSKGDKVESVKTGAKGVVDEVYGDEKYAVLFDGATNPDRVEGFQIKAANGCARNAKFKVGDKVTDGNAVYEIMDVDDGIYEWKFVSGKADPSHSEGGEIAWAEGKMRLANSAPVRSTNAVVQNAINARRARNASSDAMIKAWEDFVEDAGRFIRSTSLSRLVGLAAKTPDDEAGKMVRDVIDAATSEISAVTDKIQNIIRKYGSRL